MIFLMNFYSIKLVFFLCMHLASRLYKLEFILKLTLSLIGVTISVLSSPRAVY